MNHFYRIVALVLALYALHLLDRATRDLGFIAQYLEVLADEPETYSICTTIKCTEI